MYRLIIGEKENEQGHIIPSGAKSAQGARIALRRALAPYQGDGWGRVEAQASNGEWGSVEEADGR